MESRSRGLPYALPLLLCIVALAAGCGGREEQTSLSVALESIEPACVSSTSATTITVRGTLPVKPVVSLSSSKESTVDTGYRAWVGEVALTDVAWADAATLTATVPAGLPVGVYTVSVESPFGDLSTLDGLLVAEGCSVIPSPTPTPTPQAFRVGGVLSGLGDSRVDLELAYGDGSESDLSLDENGAFTFDALVPSGSRYSVTVMSQPKRQTCRVANGSGTIATADVSGVRVTCSGDDDDGDD